MIKFGPGGTVGLGYDEGIRKISELKLSALEVEFTYGVRMSNAEANRVGELAKNYKVSLSVHAPYYINLDSEDKKKIAASKKRILDSCERGHHLCATHIVFHAAFYGKHTPEQCYDIVRKEIIDLQSTIKKHCWDVQLAPETTGKQSQFGTVDELLRLAKETGCSFCIDFAHIYARNNGKIDYDELFRKLKSFKHIHSHFSGIEFTEKGERRHLVTDSRRIKELLHYIKKYNIDITIINESPMPYEDSVKTRELAGL